MKDPNCPYCIGSEDKHYHVISHEGVLLKATHTKVIAISEALYNLPDAPTVVTVNRDARMQEDEPDF